MSLPSFSVRQAVFVNLLFGIVVVAGLMAAARIPVDLFPDVSFNRAIVVTAWTGASADEVERLVTTRLEEEIRDVEGIKTLTSFSRSGASEIDVEWDETLSDMEYEAAINELRAAIDRVGDLPEDVEEPLIRELSVSEVNNVVMVAISDVGDVGEFTLRAVSRDLERKLERIPGVRKANLRGDRDRELRVIVDRDRAMQVDLTLAEISAVIASNNQNVPAGALTTASSEIRVRGLGNFTTSASLADTVVRKSPDGTHVRLSDIARIEADFERRTMIGRYNGLPTITVGVSKTSEADVVDLVELIRAAVDDYRGLLPPGVSATVIWDTSRLVKARIGVMVSNVILGVVFVVFLLWFTVGFRNSMIVTMGIPFSFLCGLLLFPVFDVTINLISLVGFVMVSGMLVDHAIVMVENVYRHIEDGEEFRAAIINGTEEVMWPVIATVATTLAAFIPVLMIRGTSGEFGSILPKAVILTLVGSLLEALLILPAHYWDWGSRKREEPAVGAGPSGLFARIRAASTAMRVAVDLRMDRLRDAYVRGQQRVLRHRYVFLGTCVAGLWFSCGLQQHVPVDLFPSDFNQLMVTLETSNDFGLDQTDAVMRGVEAELEGLGDEFVEDLSAYVGFGMTADHDRTFGPSHAVAFVSFPDTPENTDDPGRVTRVVRERLDAFRRAHPVGIENLLVMPPRNGPPIGKPVAIRIQADDYTLAKQVSAEMKAQLVAMPGVFNIEDNVPTGLLELRVSLDEHRASIHGLSFQDVALGLRAANDGLVPSTFKDPTSDEDVDIRVQLEPHQRAEISDLLHAEVRAAGGYLIRLADVASVELVRGYQRLYHYDARRAVVVYADVDGENATSTSVNAAMQARFADVPKRHPGVNLVFGGEYEATKNTIEDMQRALGIAVLAIYAILATLFRSYLQPLVVMSVLAFAFSGVSLGLFVTGGVLSMWVMYATVGLAGIVVNDSLVLMDFVNREREAGTPILAAVRQASAGRFRPILLTTLTTIAGLLPMSLGLTGKSLVFGPFATAIVFGLGVASLLTLFVVPALYLSIEDVRRRWARPRAEAGLPAGVVAGGSGNAGPEL